MPRNDARRACRVEGLKASPDPRLHLVEDHSGEAGTADRLPPTVNAWSTQPAESGDALTCADSSDAGPRKISSRGRKPTYLVPDSDGAKGPEAAAVVVHDLACDLRSQAFKVW
jgi:hypothetical protein